MQTNNPETKDTKVHNNEEGSYEDSRFESKMAESRKRAAMDHIE